jgi:hypothetical protein
VEGRHIRFDVFQFQRPQCCILLRKRPWKRQAKVSREIRNHEGSQDDYSMYGPGSFVQPVTSRKDLTLVFLTNQASLL